MKSIDKLLFDNKAWAKQKAADNPNFFNHLASIQRPEFLWIGCSDSRVPADQITRTEPGEIFVHRNVANLVVSTDLNLLSVLQYAVEVLEVQHVIVCGHYGCGGIRTAMTNQHLGIINHWLHHIKDTYHLHYKEIAALSDPQKREDRLVELNVQEQVMNLAKTSIIQKAWKKNKRPHLHGWVYSLHDGVLKPMLEMSPDTKIDPIYQFDNF